VVRVVGAVVVTGSPLLAVSSGETTGATSTQVAGVALMVLSAAPLGWGIAEVVCRWRPRRRLTTQVVGDPVAPRGSLAPV